MTSYQVLLSLSVDAPSAAEALQVVQSTVIQKGLQEFVYLVTEDGDAERAYFVDGVGNRLTFDEVAARNAEATAVDDDDDDDLPPELQDEIDSMTLTVDEEQEAEALAASLAETLAKNG